MVSVLAFLAVAAIAFLLMLLLDGYARHMGNTDPTDWKSAIVVSVVAGIIGAGAAALLWDVGAFVGGLFS